MWFFFGADVMEVCFFTGRMLDYCLLAKILVQSWSGQFLFRR